MPSGDEGTGLHAFDDLDPISTVSALNPMPHPEPVAAPRSVPPPPPGGSRPGGSQPGENRLPAVKASGSDPALLAPPPPRPGTGARSVPPPPPPSSRPPGSMPPAALQQPGEGMEPDEDTKVVPNAFAHGAELASSSAHEPDSGSDEGASEFDELGTPDLSASTVAANIDMDWDEDEVQTQLREEGQGDSGAYPAQPSPLVAGRPSPFPPPMPSQHSGNPSPFAAAPSFAPQHAPQDDWESEDEAQTRVLSSGPLPSLPALPRDFHFQPSDSLAPASDTATYAGTDAGTGNSSARKLTWIGVAAAALLGAVAGGQTLLAGPDPATMTLVTKPADVEVLIDGKALTGQSSPFMAQDLEPEVEHEIVVRKPGFAEQSHRFRAEPGEVKPLPGIELEPLRVDTGFALASTPEGANIYIDGEKLEQTTPARITDLEPGLHLIRLERGDGYQPWETQVALASGQVIELPEAHLVAASPAVRDTSGEPERAQAPERRTRSRGDRARARNARAPERARVASVRRPAPRSAAVASAGGSQGSLRVNSRPWAQVYVDGRLIGNTPQLDIPLPEGSHRLKLVNPQLGMSKNLRVSIRAGKTTTKIVEMME